MTARGSIFLIAFGLWIAGATLLCAGPADANVTAATGGGGISADTVSNAYTALTGPKLTEKSPAGIRVGSIILTAPAGFEFNPTSIVRVAVTGTSGGNKKTGTDVVLSNTVATVTTNTITVFVTSESAPNSRKSILTWSGVKVRPIAGSPLVSGNITKSGSSSYNEGGSISNYGTLTVVPGALSNLMVALPNQVFTQGSGFSSIPISQTSGVPFAVSKIIASDRFLNIITNYTGAKVLGYAGPGGDPSYTTNVTFTNGQSSTALMTTLRKAETTAITASDGSVAGPASSNLTVYPAMVAKLQVLVPGEAAAPGTLNGKTGTPDSQIAGVSFVASVRAVDTNWNVITSVTDTVRLAVSDLNATLPGDVVLTAGTGVFSVVLITAGTHTLTASNLTHSTIVPNTSSAITINPGAMQKLQILVPGESAAPGTIAGKTGTPTGQVAGTAFTVTVHSVDAYWNVASADHYVGITSSDANADLPDNAALAGGSRVFQVTLNTAGSAILTASDLSDVSVTNSSSPSISVAGGAFSRLQILVPVESAVPGTLTGKTGLPLPQNAGVSFPITVNAVDDHWNLVNSVTDTVHFASSDGFATLPGETALAGGTGGFNVTLNTTGPQTITVSDVTDGAKLACTSAVIAVGTATFQPATGGSAISADSAGGTYTSLTGPVIAEGTAGNIATGTITLTIPSGFVVNTGNTVLVSVTGTGSGSDVVLQSSTATVSATAVTITVDASSTGSRASTLTWSGIQVRPVSGTPLAGGFISNSGTASLAGIPSEANLGTLTQIPGAASRLTIQTQPSSTATAGVTFAQQPVIRIEDQFGNLRTTDYATLVTAARSAGSGTLQGVVSMIADSGLATFSNLAHNVAGVITVAFSSPGITGAVSDGITIAPAAASQLTFVQPPTNAVAGTAMEPPVTVQIRDSLGNAVSNGGVWVAMALSSGSGTLSGTTSNQTDVSGLATFNTLSVAIAGFKTLTASATGLVSAVSGAFAIIPAAASQLAFVQQPTNTDAGATITPAVTVQIRDAFGNTVTNAGVQVSIAISTGTGTLEGTQPIPTAVGGLATFGDLSIAAAGSKALTASSAGLTSAVSSAFTISPLSYSRVQILVPGETAAPGTVTGKTGTPTAQVVGKPLSVRVNAVDDFWNLVSTVTNTVGIYSATDTGATAPPDAPLVAGTNTFSFTFVTAGTHTLTAEDVLDANIADGTTPAILVSTTSFTFRVISPYGMASPVPGIYTNAGASVLTNSVTSPDTYGGTQYVCTGWSMTSNAPLSGATNSFSMTLTNNAVLTWQWSTNYLLGTATNGNGSVTAGRWLALGAQTAVTATAASHWHFTGWAGDTQGCAIAGNVITALMTRARNLTANFEIDQYTITSSAGPNGSIAPSGVVPVAYGGGTNFTMTPAADHHVGDVLIDGVSTGATNAYAFANVTSNRTIDVSFVIDTTLRITNMISGTRLPFRATQYTIAGRTVNIAGTMWYTNSWGRGFQNGTLPAATNWSLPLNLPTWGTYRFTVYGTNTTGGTVQDTVTFGRNRNQVFWFSR